TELERALINISAVIEQIASQTADAVQALQEEVRGLSCVVLQNRTALDYLLAAEGGVCN
ncbi:ERVV1 protein, partial [Neodrepanis coruscans]|nr:ERVV1 protein [Neodrepanis coruscans]